MRRGPININKNVVDHFFSYFFLSFHEAAYSKFGRLLSSEIPISVNRSIAVLKPYGRSISLKKNRCLTMVMPQRARQVGALQGRDMYVIIHQSCLTNSIISKLSNPNISTCDFTHSGKMGQVTVHVLNGPTVRKLSHFPRV